MEIVSTISLISINGTILVQMVSFLIFLFIINRVMFRPLQQTLDERDQYIKNLQSEIDKSATELETLTNRIRQGESGARAEALDLAKQAESSGSLQASEIFTTTRKDVSVQIEKAREESDAMIETAGKDIKAASEALAITIMEQLLDRKLPQ